MFYNKYSDAPVFGGFLDESFPNEISTGNALRYFFAAYDASVTFDNIFTPNKFLGRFSTPGDFALTGPTEAKFSMSFFPIIPRPSNVERFNINKDNQIGFFNLTGDFLTGHNLFFGEYLLKRTYLQNYSIKINPLQPISVTANFISYDISNSISGYFLPSDKAKGSLNSSFYNNSLPEFKINHQTLHAVTTRIIHTNDNLPITKLSVEVNVDCNRTPVYEVGSRFASRVMLNSVERTTTIQGEDIGRLYDSSSLRTTDLRMMFLPYSSIGETPNEGNAVFGIDVSGVIASQQLSVSQNSIVNGKVVIKENLL